MIGLAAVLASDGRCISPTLLDRRRLPSTESRRAWQQSSSAACARWLGVPMLKEGDADRRHRDLTARSRGRSPSEQIALLQTFADQAVIAIENVRLFNETKEALDQLRAPSAEVLQVISQLGGGHEARVR